MERSLRSQRSAQGVIYKLLLLCSSLYNPLVCRYIFLVCGCANVSVLWAILSVAARDRVPRLQLSAGYVFTASLVSCC